MLDNFYSISINDDRYNFQCERFKKCNLPIPKKYTGFKSFKNIKNYTCCLFSHMSLIMMARCMNLPYIFIFEDDAYPRIDAKDEMIFYINKKPINAGILVFGYNGYSGSINDFDDFFIVEDRPFGAHAYLVYKNTYDEILKSMENVRIADIALKGHNYSINNKPYWVKDYLFIQYNIDNKCMSHMYVEQGDKFFYPNQINGNLSFNKDLPDGDYWK